MEIGLATALTAAASAAAAEFCLYVSNAVRYVSVFAVIVYASGSSFFVFFLIVCKDKVYDITFCL